MKRFPPPTFHSAIGSTLIFLAIFILSTAHADEKTSAAAPTTKKQDQSPVQVSGLTLDHFDQTVRPQDDFYQYVNGAWLKTFKLPPEKSRYGVFNDLHERARTQLKAIILELSDSSRGTKPNNLAFNQETQKVSDAYRAFMDQERLEQLGIKPLADDLSMIQAINTPSDLMAYLGHSWRTGSSSPVEGWIDQDAKEPTRYTLYLTQSGLGLPDRDYYLKEDGKLKEARVHYTEYLAHLFEMSTIKSLQTKSSELAAHVVDLERSLAKAQWTRAESRQREKTYNKYSLKQLSDGSTLDWTVFFQSISKKHASKLSDVIIRQPSFFKALDSLIKTTSIATWRAYLSARLMSHFAPLMGKRWVSLHFEFYGKQLSGKEKNEPRWKRGIGHVEKILGEALGKIYVTRHFKPAAKIRMEKLVNNLLIAFRAGIKDLEWMGKKTKSAALKKLDHFTVKIGYPNQWRDYTLLAVSADDLIGNAKRASLFSLNRELDKLGKPIDREEWFMPPQTVNAYYNPSMNEIVFPAAILQPPFFNMDADDAVNYGGIGAVIGHEISHGFDDQGRKSDGEGRLTDWWTKEDASRFNTRANKLSKHYESYTPLKDMKINGALTLGENIGDLGGLTIAYRAYHLSLKGLEGRIMDSFSGPQRFFLSWAQVWACKYRNQELRRRLLTDPHSPAMYRVTGIIRQMPAFYEAFDVTSDDKLYLPPAQRVKIW